MTAKKAAAKPEEGVAKQEVKKTGSVVSGLDIEVRNLTDVIEAKAKEVGGDIPRGFATRAVALLREAQELLYKAEREDR